MGWVVLFFFFPSLLFSAFSQHTGAEGGVSPDRPSALVCSCGWHPRPGTLLSPPRPAQGFCPPCLLLPGKRKRHRPFFKSRCREVRAQPFSSIPVMSEWDVCVFIWPETLPSIGAWNCHKSEKWRGLRSQEKNKKQPNFISFLPLFANETCQSLGISLFCAP